ncbi:hypothetical protein [Vibrio nereis]|nr:hypothetical protein [Vibrio nereis]
MLEDQTKIMNVFPEIKQPEGSLYCGPYCVVACLHALGKLPLNKPVEFRRYSPAEREFSGSLVCVDSKYDNIELALELYKITGIITPGENPEYIDDSGYNSLAAMLYVLGLFELKCEVVTRDHETYEYLTSVFPTEFKLFETLGIPVRVLGQNPSTPTGTLLISVISVNNSLHYVLNNDQREWFDSHHDASPEGWGFIENWHKSANKREGATWLGVSIRVLQ